MCPPWELSPCSTCPQTVRIWRLRGRYQGRIGPRVVSLVAPTRSRRPAHRSTVAGPPSCHHSPLARVQTREESEPRSRERTRHLGCEPHTTGASGRPDAEPSAHFGRKCHRSADIEPFPCGHRHAQPPAGPAWRPTRIPSLLPGEKTQGVVSRGSAWPPTRVRRTRSGSPCFTGDLAIRAGGCR